MEKNRGVLLSEMSEVKDPAIKLFGKTIQLPSNDDVSLDPSPAHLVLLDSDGNSDPNNLSCSDGSVSPKSFHHKRNAANESKQENSSMNNESESSSSQETPLKKPDKIIPCPRCNSMDTKFCYFNNYNVNQPRHFCKGCQRYWTAGGAIRNVPVGSGRRKAKTSMNPNPFIVPESTNLMVSALNIAEQSSFQVPFYAAPPWYPAPYSPFWGACNVPWQATGSSLGKHSREGEVYGCLRSDEEEDEEKTTKVLVPKTLRIDDPSEAAKSSIWATLGIRNGRGADSINSGGVFGGFRSKGGEMNSAAEGSLVLQANPAAFSRSLRFHESAE